MLSEQTFQVNEEIEEILLVACLDGKIYAINANDGQIMWINDEIFEGATFSVFQNIRSDRIFYVMEPFQEGNIYACIEGHSVQKLPISMKKIIDTGPISWSDGTIFLGHKRSDIFKLDPASGRITDSSDDFLVVGVNDYSLQASRDFYESNYCDFSYREITEIFDSRREQKQDFDSTANLKIDKFKKPFIHLSIDGYLFFKKEWNVPHLKWIQKFEFPITSLLIAKKATNLNYYQSEIVYPQIYKNKEDYLHFGFIEGQIYVLPNSVYPLFSKAMKPYDQNHLKFYEIIKKYKDKNVHAAISTEPLHYIQASKPIGLLGASKNRTGQHQSWILLFIVFIITSYYLAIIFKKAKIYKDVLEETIRFSDFVKMQINLFDVSNDNLPKFLNVTDTILGYGSHGTIVFEGSFDKRKVAVKRFLSDFYDVAEQEVDLLQHSDHHPNIIRYYCRERTERFIFIALELCPHSLVDVVEHRIFDLSFSRKKEIILEILNGVDFLHSRGILHRDLKPANIMISSDNRILISDFGLSRKITGQFEFTEHSSGTLGWRAPEVVISELANNPIMLTRSADIFSFGCICYYIITSGKHPFGEKSNREINIIENNICLDLLEDGDALFRELVLKLLEHDYKRRPMSKNIKFHPFFWADSMKLRFLMDLSDFLETQDRRQSILLKKLEQIRFRVFNFKKMWKEQLDPSFMLDLEKHRYYNYYSLQDLLRAIRNKRHHLDDKNDRLIDLIGTGDTSFLKYINEQFPTLISEIFKLLEVNTKELHSDFIQLYHLDKLKLYI